MVDPATWPSMVAEAKTLIRETLSYEKPLDITDTLNEMMTRRGHDGFIANANEARRRLGDEYILHAGEVAWAVGEALRELESNSEIRQLGGGMAFYGVKAIGENLGYDTMTQGDYRFARWFGPTPKRAALSEYESLDGVRWDSALRLLEEARKAHLHRLPLIAVVGARVTAEETLRLALIDLGVPEEDQAVKAWKREEILFEILTGSGPFEPLDRSSTLAIFSAVRDAGNDAVHTGKADDAHLAEFLMSLLPRALQSLSAAVENKVG